MNNSMYKRVCILGLFSLLVACGGGGGGDDSSSSSAASDNSSTAASTTSGTDTSSTTDDSSSGTTTTDSVDDEPVSTTDDEQAAVDVESLSNLFVGSENELLSEYTLFVGIDTGYSDRAYVSICEEFITKDEGGYKVDYDTCLIRGPLNEGVLVTDLVLGTAQQELIVAIWTFDGSQPAYHVWRYDENLTNQSLMIN